jgi:subfamily B ATP-binding cassette protein MsbA
MVVRLKKHMQSDFLWLVMQIKRYWFWQIASVVCMILSTMAALTDPLILKWLIDSVIPRHMIRLIPMAALFMFLAYSVRILLGGIAGLITYHVNQKFILNLRIRLFEHINKLGSDYHDSTPVGTTMYVIRDSLEELGSLSADFFPLVLRTMILSIFTIGTMMRLSSHLTLLMLPLIPLFIFTIRYFKRNLQRTCDEVQARGSLTAAFLQEHLSSTIQIQLLTRERLQLLKAFRVWSYLVRAGYGRKRAEFYYALCSTFIVVLSIVIVVAYGGLEVMRNALSVGGLVAFYSYLGRLFEPLYVTVDMNSRFQRAKSCIRRIRDVLEKSTSIVDPAVPVLLPAELPGSNIFVKDLSFSYTTSHPVLDRISLSIHSNERVALVGPSGCGKSTLAKLLVRLYPVGEETIIVDDVDLNHAGLKNIRHNICYVPQRAKLFNDTLESNLLFGNPRTTRDLLKKAAAIAGLLPVIEKLPDGWSQKLGPSGELLSGGERQRVAIARAILRNPRVLILDESTSELDSLTEQALFERLNEYLPQTTIIIISHRLTALSWVDRIFVMDQGRIVEEGTHDELSIHGRLYIMLYNQDPEITEVLR